MLHLKENFYKICNIVGSIIFLVYNLQVKDKQFFIKKRIFLSFSFT